jgi:hypothetical protein
MKSAHAVTRRYLPNSPFKPPPDRPVKQFTLHDQVTHDRYGLGVVIGVEAGVAVLIDFGPQQERITAPYNQMIKL